MSLSFFKYETQAEKTASYKSADYLPLGLAEECGELVQLFAAAKRKDQPVDVQKLISECGDVLWVLSQIARENDFSLEDAANNNMDKLAGRTAAGTVHNKTNRDKVNYATLSYSDRCAYLRNYRS